MSWEIAGVAALVLIVGAFFWLRRAGKKKQDPSKAPEEIYPLW